MKNKFFTFEKKKYFSGVNDYISTQTYIMAEKEKREKREEKRDGFQPFYSHPGPWNNFGFPYSHGPQFQSFYSYPGPWNNFGFPYGYGPQFPHPSSYPCPNWMVKKED